MLTKLTKQNREFTRKSLGFPPEKLGKAKINMGTQPATSGMLAMLAVPRNWWEVSQTSMTSIGKTWRASRCQMGDYSQWWLNSGLLGTSILTKMHITLSSNRFQLGLIYISAGFLA